MRLASYRSGCKSRTENISPSGRFLNEEIWRFLYERLSSLDDFVWIGFWNTSFSQNLSDLESETATFGGAPDSEALLKQKKKTLAGREMLLQNVSLHWKQ